MKKLLLTILLALLLCFGAAASENAGPEVLGQPFPDFTVEDTRGNTFTLSEALKDHEAVVINLWATWCKPCENEMPFLNRFYEEYKDRAALIALSIGTEDTMEIIEAYRQAHELDFPMGRDENSALYEYLGRSGVPCTVIVDRFGNAAFIQISAFNGFRSLELAAGAFLGEDYTETTILDSVPKDTSTQVFLLAPATEVIVENEGARPVLFHVEGETEPLPAYVVYDDTAHFRLKAALSDNPENLFLYDSRMYNQILLSELFDPERGVYTYDSPMPDAEDDMHFTCISLVDAEAMEKITDTFVIAGDEYIDELVDNLTSQGKEVSWEYAQPAAVEAGAPRAYILHVNDQNGEPVPGVVVNFCTDIACSMARSDESGIIRFDGKPDTYHIQLLKVPEGYSFDSGFDFYTTDTYGEWELLICAK